MAVSSQRRQMPLRTGGYLFSMAICKINLPDEIYKAIEKLSDKTDEVIKSTLEEGGKVALDITKGNLRKSVTNSSKRMTGELVDSLGMTKVRINSKGIHNIKIGFNEPRRKQYRAKKKRSYNLITNALIAGVLEYGKSGQQPRPFLKPSKSKSKKACVEAMKRKLDEEVGKLGVK